MQVYLDEKEGLQQVSEHRNPEPPFQKKICLFPRFIPFTNRISGAWEEDYQILYLCKARQGLKRPY